MKNVGFLMMRLICSLKCHQERVKKCNSFHLLAGYQGKIIFVFFSVDLPFVVSHNLLLIIFSF